MCPESPSISRYWAAQALAPSLLANDSATFWKQFFLNIIHIPYYLEGVHFLFWPWFSFNRESIMQEAISCFITAAVICVVVWCAVGGAVMLRHAWTNHKSAHPAIVVF